jgi:hypothetical protein
VVAANRPSSVFALAHQGIFGADGTSSFTIHPLNNVNFIARSGNVSSAQVIVSVHSAVNITVKRVSGHILTFSGQVYPGRDGQVVTLFSIVNGVSTKVGVTTVHGNAWSFTHDFASAAGKKVVLYAYTASDTQNAFGHSPYLAALL